MKKKNKSAQIDVKALRALLKSVSRKTKLSNVVTAAMAVVVLIGLASSTPIQNYFKSQPSSAAGIGANPGGGLSPTDPWTPEGIETKLIPPFSVGAKIHNNKVVFLVSNEATDWQDIFVYDLTTTSYSLVCVGDYFKGQVDIYDNYVIWNDGRTAHVNDLYLYNLKTKTETQVSHNVYIPNVIQELNGDIAIYGNKIVWRKMVHLAQTPSENYQKIMLYNINTGITKTIATIQGTPDIDIDSGLTIEGNKIVWSDHSSGVNNLYLYDLFNETETSLTESTVDMQINPDIYGSYVVWEDWNSPIPGDAAIRMKNISTDQEYILAEHGAYFPAVYRNIIVWQQFNQQQGTFDIWMHKISDPVGVNYKITNNNREQRWPEIFANKIIWEDDRDGVPWPAPFTWDIYMFELMN